jgi:hypothetical protein
MRKLFAVPARAGRGSRSRRRPVRRGAVRPTLEALDQRTLLAAGPLGLNFDFNVYSTFVNWLQEPGNYMPVPGQSNPIVLNASGDPSSDAVLLFDLRVNQSWNGPDPNAVPPDLSGTYHLSFNGQAQIQPEYPGFSTPFTIQNQTYNAATNTTTADLVVPTGTTAEFFAIEFLNTRATAASPTNTGFSNAVMIRPGYAAGSTQLFTNQFISALAPFGTLRTLGVDGANTQPFMNGNTLVTIDWSDRYLYSQPWEYVIALANQKNADVWINIPQGATDDYITGLANLFKNGDTYNGVVYPGLKPNLKIYLEYSNEVWGGIPANLFYQEQAVQNLADNHPLSTFPGNLNITTNVDGTTNSDVYTLVGRRYLERTYNISQIFQSVLGADPTHQRIRPVLGWQENQLGFYPPALDWFEHFFGSASSAFYGMGNANYWNPTDYSSVDTVINTLAAQEQSYAIPNAINYTTIASYYGLKNVSYEGGPAISGDGNTQAGQNALAASRDPRMEQLVYQHYINYYAAGGDVANYLSGPFGTWSPQNEWYLAELYQLNNPTAAAKYRGTVDIANAAPVAVTAGVEIPSGGSASFAASTDTLGSNFSSPNTGQDGYWLIRADAAGYYDLKLTTNAGGGTSPGVVALSVDDKVINGSVNVTSSSTIDLGTFFLHGGLNTIKLHTVHGTNDPGAPPGTYNFQPNALILSAAQANVVTESVAWGTVGFAQLTYDDGTRLLPSGRRTDLPWLGINRISITLSAPEPLSASDVTVTSAIGKSYGPVTVSGGGTSYTITLAAPINDADRVTVSIGNGSIATFTRRLDVLPGDVTDDGSVNFWDIFFVQYLAQGNTSQWIPLIFADFNGDGVVDMADFNIVVGRNGSHLP